MLKRLTKTFEPPVKILLEYDLETKDIYQVIYVTVQIDVWSFKGTDDEYFSNGERQLKIETFLIGTPK